MKSDQAPSSESTAPGKVANKKWYRYRRVVLLMPLCAVTIFAVLWYFLLRPSAEQRIFTSTKGLEEYLAANGGWVVPKPPRSDWLPGTVLMLENDIITTFMSHHTLCPPDTYPSRIGNTPITSFLANATTSDASDAKFLIGKTAVKGAAESATTISISSDSLEVHYIERSLLLRAVRANQDISQHLAKPTKRLFLITEVIIANTLKYRQVSGIDASVAAETTKAIEAKFNGSLKGDSDSSLISTTPIVIGFHATEITREATSLGPAKDLHLRDRSYDDTKTISESVALATTKGNMMAMCNIHILSIGLDMYASPVDSPVGGWLEGAAESACLVVNRFMSLDSDRHKCYATLFAPTLTKGSVRSRVTSGQLRRAVDAWFDDREALILSKRASGDILSKHIFVVDCCGHGIAHSANGYQYLAPENYISKPPSHEPSADTALVLNTIHDAPIRLAVPLIVFADCCRTEDARHQNMRRLMGGDLGSSIDSMARMMFSFENNTWATMMYGVVVDREAPVVMWKYNGSTVPLGPLAVEIDMAFRHLSTTPRRVSLRDFVELLRKQSNPSLGLPGAFCDRDPDDSTRRTKWASSKGGPVIGNSSWDKATVSLYDSIDLAVPRDEN